MGTIKLAVKRLIQNSLSPSTKSSYRHAIGKYDQFVQHYHSQVATFPVNYTHLHQFIAFLHCSGTQASSVQSFLSAINFIHKAMGGQDIFEDFWLSRIILGYKKLSVATPDKRLPISLDILFRLCTSLQSLPLTQFEIIMFQAMFLLSFYALLRVGEITVTSLSAQNPNLLLLNNLCISPNSSDVTITFTSYKHCRPLSPITLVIPPNPGPHSLPNILSKYLHLRGSTPGPLFMFNNAPVTRSFYTQTLAKCLKFCGFDPSKYKSHSFRIGSATTAIQKGTSQFMVQQMGRWNSDAFKKYIRIPQFNRQH